MNIFGGNTGMTYEEVQQKRKIAERLMAGNAARAPRNVGEGLTAIGNALLSRSLNKSAAAADKANRDEFNSQWGALFPSAGGSAPVAGTQGGIRPSSGMASYRDAIASIESAGSGDYQAIGPTNEKLGRALGRYQIMEANLAPWSQAALGRTVAADEFLASPEIQDAIFDHRFGGYVDQFGPEGAAQAWFAGPGGVGKMGRKDVLGTSVADYTQKFNSALGGGMPQASIQQLAQIASNPYASPGQKAVVNALMQRQMQQSDPAYQLDLQLKRAQLDAARNPQAKERDMKKDANDRWRYTDGDKELVFDVPVESKNDDMTESERRIFMFNNIQKQTGPAINMIEYQGFDPSNIQDKLSGGVLGGNFFKSTEGQMYEAAAGAWAESALRLATGAAATPEEYTRIRNMYFAAAGDSPETIQFKRAMREGYQTVLGATLQGDINQEMPSPLPYAIEQYYAQGAEPVPEDAAKPQPPLPEWNGPSAEQIRSMSPVERSAMMSAYSVESIPDEILDLLLELGGR